MKGWTQALTLSLTLCSWANNFSVQWFGLLYDEGHLIHYAIVQIIEIIYALRIMIITHRGVK